MSNITNDFKRKGMRFKAFNGGLYTLSKDQYESKVSCKIVYQTSSAFFYENEILYWSVGIGEGSIVQTPDGNTVCVGEIEHKIIAEEGRNVKCCDGQTYFEFDLEPIKY